MWWGMGSWRVPINTSRSAGGPVRNKFRRMSGETLADPAGLPVGVCAAISSGGVTATGFGRPFFAVFDVSIAQLCATAKPCRRAAEFIAATRTGVEQAGVARPRTGGCSRTDRRHNAGRRGASTAAGCPEKDSRARYFATQRRVPPGRLPRWTSAVTRRARRPRISVCVVSSWRGFISMMHSEPSAWPCSSVMGAPA